MAHFAKILNDKVVQVIVAEPEFFNTFIDITPGEWLQCSYNTVGGEHLLGGEPLRKNFPGVGYSYDKERDAFIPPQPYPSWSLNEDTCLWECPVEKPDTENFYDWNEENQTWDLVDGN